MTPVLASQTSWAWHGRESVIKAATNLLPFSAHNTKRIILLLSSPSTHATFSEPVTRCHVVSKSLSWIVIKEAKTSCCKEGAAYASSCICPLLQLLLTSQLLARYQTQPKRPIQSLLTPHLICDAFRHWQCAHWAILERRCWGATRSDGPKPTIERTCDVGPSADEAVAQLSLGIVSEGVTGWSGRERCLYWALCTRKMFSEPYLSFYPSLLETISRRYSGITAHACLRACRRLSGVWQHQWGRLWGAEPTCITREQQHAPRPQVVRKTSPSLMVATRIPGWHDGHLLEIQGVVRRVFWGEWVQRSMGKLKLKAEGWEVEFGLRRWFIREMEVECHNCVYITGSVRWPSATLSAYYSFLTIIDGRVRFKILQVKDAQDNNS